MTGSRAPYLGVWEPAGDTRAVALVLHGGREDGVTPVRANQLAVLRMRPFAGELRRVGREHGLAVARLRYLVRGWNGARRSPVHDVEWAVGQLAHRFPGAPVALVGHSMGGRAAVYAAGAEPVRTVVGLAPWIEPGDPVDQLAGRRVLIVHGDADRTTSPANSQDFAAAANRVADEVGYVGLRGERHPMLRRPRLWHRLSAGFVLATLCAVPPAETVGGDAANVLAKVFAGTARLVV
ncbi:alpha/beta hydrolase [uncultured Jatrophihabitans sp.]|uniref:alpha/beta hydrolase n=1 Tax=uncultured Jatrophihabitans sp. TaxID=1610747 RepID=UPI0035CBCD80